MQKKLIALAVAGMVAAPLAMAQSNVTIYGVMDLGLNYQSSHSGTFSVPTAGGPLEFNKAKSRTGLDSGQQSGSRLGFRGTEDLGNGLKASFVLEYGHDPDVDNALTFNRQSFLALSGDFGTVAVGRQYTPQFGLIARLDPFGAGTAGNMANIYAWNTRLDNTVAYVSPNFNGLTVTVAHSFNAGGQEVAKKGGNAKVWAVSPRYANGPIDVQLNWHQIKSDVSGSKAEKVWDLGGAYDFGVAKVAAVYGQRKQSGAGLTAADETFLTSLGDGTFVGIPADLADGIASANTNIGKDNRYWMIGASAPVGEAGTFLISYTHSKWKEWDSKATQWAIGYNHKLSARTNIYSAYAKRGSDFGLANSQGQLTAAGAYKSQLTVGLRHMF